MLSFQVNKTFFAFLLGGLVLLECPTRAEVRVYVQDVNGLAWIKYECTRGELVRAFALDVTVEKGEILGVTNFFRGPSTAQARGYGIFPASLRDNLTVNSTTNANWESSDYTPLAAVSDAPDDTLPGLGSQGVTLEFGALWNPDSLEAAPETSGTLCALELSQPTTVTITPNQIRGGIVAASPEQIFSSEFFPGEVAAGVAITGISVENGEVKVTFTGGELQIATTLDGDWTPTGNTNGTYTATVAEEGARFFRVIRE